MNKPFSARVITGKGRGKIIGFPTFNLAISKDFSPKEGIYACWVWLAGKKYRGALHFGPIPVFKEKTPKLEIFVLDYKYSNQPKTITFELIQYLRPIKNFSSAKALAAQISHDVKQVRRLLS